MRREEQKQVKKTKQKYKKIIYAMIIAFAVISVWRGFWGLLDEYLFPTNHKLSLWVSLFAGLLILIIMHKAIDQLM